MKQTANMRNNATSFRPKKHQDENASEASDFMQPFPDVYKAFGTSNDHQKPIYVSPGGRKRTPTAPLASKKKCNHKSSYFPQIANSRFLLINPQTITFARTNHSEKPRRKVHCLGIPTTQKFEKNSFLVNFHIWHKFSSFKTTNCLLLGSNRSHYVY